MAETMRRSDLPAPGAPPGLPASAAILARSGGENFTVASRLLPPPTRERLLAFYGYARLVDQLGDAYAGDRLAALDWVDDQLDTALGVTHAPAARRRPAAGPGAEVHPLIAAAAAAVVAAGTGEEDLRALVEANRTDQRTRRYRSFDDLAGYCRLSANPVGRLVLAGFGATTPERVAWSDSICTGLQLAEHWQDVAEDARAGRIYLPLDDLERFGVGEDEVVRLARHPAPARSAVRGLLGFQTARARSLLVDGAPLVASLRGPARIAVAGYVAGGLAALDAIAAAGFDPFPGPPRPRRARTTAHAAAMLARAGRGGTRRSPP